MGYQILEKRVLGPDSHLLVVKASHVARSAKPGQFVVLRIYEKGERIPLTIANSDKEKGTVSIIFQVVGKTTQHLSSFNEGDEIYDFLGPLGTPTEIEKFGCVAALGGGFGTAVLYPLVRALKSKDNYVIVVNGARNEKFLILEDELKRLSDEYYVTTDDGSKGFKGFVTDFLRHLIENEHKKIDRVFAVGPVLMMKSVAGLTKKYTIKTIVSLNPIMVDGTGMCGACRVEIGDETKFACVDGPDFDAHKVNFDLLTKRLQMYKKEEEICLAKIIQKSSGE
ncbi:sulfide/dihydroorotate dehydrogenase-like FAD/NAD-binding protein [Candidatus Aerophobetes bacterium]|nr:sulfide/dihydroorotate dehydrogenase-like FAD/NAD-binding protein [Candidatus Aerophobetes bacterium]